ncbi:hypothetical protein ACJRW5_13245 [Pseudomonas sp. SH1-B]
MDLRRFVSENYILAGAPVLGWFAALGYERGYADFYSYSMDFVSIDFKSIMLSLMVVVMYASLALYIVHIIRGATDSNNAFVKSLGYVGMFSLAPLLVAFCVAFKRSQMYLLAFGFLVALCFIYMAPLFFGEGKYLDRLRGVLAGLESPLTIRDSLRDVSGISRVLVCITFGLMFYSFCYGAGSFHAKNKREFYMHELNGAQYVVLAAYGDTLVSARLSDDEIAEDILVRKVVSEDGVFYKKIKLEPGGGKE